MKNSYGVAHRIVFTIILILALSISMQGMALSETIVATAAPEEPVLDAEVTTEPEEDVESATDAPAVEAQQSNWWNILLLGGDSRSEKSFERTDSIIILSINETTGKAKMTSIMRDTWVSYPGKSGKGKINAANVFGGPELAMATVNECFGTDIKDYVLINMVGLVDVIDQVGGIDIAVTASERKWINVHVKDYLVYFGSYNGDISLDKSGDPVHLNGLLAMTYCRNRSIGTDYARTQRQRAVLMAFLDKLRTEGPVQLAVVVSSAFDNVKTNLNLANLLTLANFGLKLDTESIEQYRIPADGTFESGMKDGFWSIRPDFGENKKLLHDFIYGEHQ